MKLKFLTLFLLFAISAKAQNLTLYALFVMQQEADGGEKLFVSLSDTYALSEDPNLSAVPDVSGKTYTEAEYFKLEKPYKQRFLQGAKLSEQHTVYIYDYVNNKVFSIPVKQADVVAWLSPYVSEGDEISQYEYMVGFEIPAGTIKGSSDYPRGIVCIAKSNPFEEGKMKPMVWKDIAEKEFPSVPLNAENKARMAEYGPGYKITGTYSFQNDGLAFYVQDYQSTKEWPADARRVIVLDAKTKKPLRDVLYTSGESTMIVPLGEEAESTQFTGRLLKGKPPVMFGFSAESFDCESVMFIGGKDDDLRINCDNRH